MKTGCLLFARQHHLRAALRHGAGLDEENSLQDSRESLGEPVRFISRAAVFAGSPEAILADWPLTQVQPKTQTK
jgi:hypothetical protein